jgi:hypothetical protein
MPSQSFQKIFRNPWHKHSEYNLGDLASVPVMLYPHSWVIAYSRELGSNSVECLSGKQPQDLGFVHTCQMNVQRYKDWERMQRRLTVAC